MSETMAISSLILAISGLLLRVAGDRQGAMLLTLTALFLSILSLFL